jgi:hypothetical protein
VVQFSRNTVVHFIRLRHQHLPTHGSHAPRRRSRPTPLPPISRLRAHHYPLPFPSTAPPLPTTATSRSPGWLLSSPPPSPSISLPAPFLPKVRRGIGSPRSPLRFAPLPSRRRAWSNRREPTRDAHSTTPAMSFSEFGFHMNFVHCCCFDKLRHDHDSFSENIQYESCT